MRALDGVTHKGIFIESTTVYVPSSELGLSQLLSRLVCPSPQNQGTVESQFQTTGEKA